MNAKRKETKGKRHANVKKKAVSLPGTPRISRKLLTEPGDLPDSYGETRVVLLPVDPYLVHVYWEINPKEFEKTQKKLGKKRTHVQPVLRFFDITNIIFDGANAHGFFDIPVDLPAGNWYVHLWSPEKSYFVELGLKTEKGSFSSIGRSNNAETPRAWPPPGEPGKHTFISRDTALSETAPLPGEQPATRLIVDLSSQVKPEKKIPRERTISATPDLPADALLRKVAELFRPQSVFDESFKPTPLQMHEPFHPGYGKESDLTDMNEKSFMPGLSSDAVTTGEQQ